MNISQLTEVDYTIPIVAAVVAFLILVAITLLGYFNDHNKLRSSPPPEGKFFSTASRLAAKWVSFFVLVAALAFTLIWALMQQDGHKMSQEKVSEWMDVEYGIDELIFYDEGKDQPTDLDGDIKPKEIVTGLMDGQRISFYFHEDPSGDVHPMMIHKEIPKLYPAEEGDSEK